MDNMDNMDLIGMDAGEACSLFFSNITKVLDVEKYPTGLTPIDHLLHGGIPVGVNYIGAMPGIGKTSLMLQMVYNMAKNNIPCIYISLDEDSRTLSGKMISRNTFEHCGGELRLAKSYNDLFGGSFMKNPPKDEWIYFQKYVKECMDLSPNLEIYTTTGEPVTVQGLMQCVMKYVEKNNKHPVIYLDCLQFLESGIYEDFIPENEKLEYITEKLYTLSQKYDIPIISVSFINRDSYYKDVTLKSFDGVAPICHTADTIIGISPLNKEERIIDDFSVSVQKVRLDVLKSNYGDTGSVDYDFFGAYSYFREAE